MAKSGVPTAALIESDPIEIVDYKLYWTRCPQPAQRVKPTYVLSMSSTVIAYYTTQCMPLMSERPVWGTGSP